MDLDRLRELVLQSLELERGGVKVHETALRCAAKAAIGAARAEQARATMR